MLELKPVVNKDTLIQQVYQELRQALLTGRFKPGQRVTVRQITELMGVSTTPVREALGRISQDGGLHYAGPKTNEVPVLTREQFTELEEIRVALERTLAPAIIANADDEFLARLVSVNDEFVDSRKQGDFAAALEKNLEFHFMLYDCAQRPFTVRLLASAWLVTGPVLGMLYPRYSQEESGVVYHHAAIEAIRRGDVDALAEALVGDTQTGYGKIRAAMSEDEVISG